MLAYKFTRLDRRHLYATKGVAALTDGHFIKYSEDRDSATGLRRGVPLVLVDTNVGKQRVADRVREHRLHFPVADWAHEEFFEQLVAEEAQPIWNPAGIRVGQKWVKQRPRNEILDLVVLNYAARQIRATADLNVYRQQAGLPPA
jgi:phage terminase large subunit GpA-like protein